jgi:dihydrofolate synthase / folylpolyglutamate synthase
VPLPTDLAGWLAYVERQHPQTIAMGLERVAQVLARLATQAFCPIFTVGGTNGKGSTCAMLDSILRQAGYRVGMYQSPHLLRYNERVRVAGVEASDDVLVDAFARVEAARGDIPLTYFEFGTLAAWLVFAASRLDALVLEIGLGGRLDAVNAFDADCAILTSVDLDHQEYLGDTRERIGWEKAHIFRTARPAIVADPEPPASVFEVAREVGADLQVIGRDFGFEGDRQQWRFWGRRGKRGGLAHPALRGANQLLNASAALAALDAMRDRLPVSAGAIRQGFALVELPGRFQVLPGTPTVILDVAHNPHAAAVLAANLDRMPAANRTFAVLGMLRDKDIAGVCARLAGRIDEWFVAPLPGPRGASAGEVHAAIQSSGAGGVVFECASVSEALAAARSAAGGNDRICVFGSFLTVAAALADTKGS